MELFETLRKRHSTRQFGEGQIPNGSLEQILLAGSMAPIGQRLYNTLHLTVIQNKELLDEISSITAISRGTPEANPLFDAPTLIVISSNDDRGASIEYANAACIIENMTLAATALGLGSIYLWGVISATNKTPETLKKLNLPEGYKALSSLAVGYLGQETVPLKELEHKFTMDYIL